MVGRNLPSTRGHLSSVGFRSGAHPLLNRCIDDATEIFFHIIAHPDFGLPYGQDRLIPIWIATLAVRQKSNVVRFRAAAELLEFFHLSKDGRHYRRIVEGSKRVFAATIFFGTDEQANANRLIDFARFHFFDSMHLWFSGSQNRAQSATDDENVITLSGSFYDEINQHRIPVEREVLSALANAPGVLDFYVWLSWKAFTLRGRAAQIPLLGPIGLATQLGNAPYAVQRTFRLTVQHWLRTVRALWPECPATLTDHGNFLSFQRCHPSCAVRATCRANFRLCNK